MPMTYERKTDRGQYLYSDLVKALDDIKNGMSIRQISMESGIPRTTLKRKYELYLSDSSTSLETNWKKFLVFNAEEENDLANFIQQC